jgi:hypothetical protein
LVETSRLKRLLTAVGTVNSEAPGTYQLRGWDKSEGLKSLEDRAAVTADEMASWSSASLALSNVRNMGYRTSNGR